MKNTVKEEKKEGCCTDNESTSGVVASNPNFWSYPKNSKTCKCNVHNATDLTYVKNPSYDELTIFSIFKIVSS